MLSSEQFKISLSQMRFCRFSLRLLGIPGGLTISLSSIARSYLIH